MADLMRLSRLIKVLTKIEEEKGDMFVSIRTQADKRAEYSVINVKVRKCTSETETYFRLVLDSLLD